MKLNMHLCILLSLSSQPIQETAYLHLNRKLHFFISFRLFSSVHKSKNTVNKNR